MDGIIIVNKEKGYTSHDCVAKMRGILQQKKIGHTGTLDPDATGVLPICLGKGTKVCDLLTDRDKEYEAVIQFGFSTDTQDISGEILERGEVHLDSNKFHQLIENFIGDIKQIPPMYSAIKIKGKHLYELARQGIEVERKERNVHISQIEILGEDWEQNQVTIRVSCSKGTYIRTLCHDIGIKAGCFATMYSLKRTRVGEFSLIDALTLGEIEALRDNHKLDMAIKPIDSLFEAYPKCTITLQGEKYLYNGNELEKDEIVEDVELNDGAIYRIYNANQQFCALYKYQDNRFTVVKMFR